MKKNLLLLLLLTSLFSQSLYSQQFSAQWEPVKKRGMQWDRFKIIGTDENSYYRYEELWDIKFPRSYFFQKIVRYNKSNEIIGSIVFETGYLGQNEPKTISDFVFTHDRVILYRKDYISATDSISIYLKSIKLDLSEQTDWMNLIKKDIYKSNIHNLNLCYAEKEDKVMFYFTSQKTKDDTTSLFNYELYHPTSLKLMGKNNFFMNATAFASSEFETLNMDKDEIVLKFRSSSHQKKDEYRRGSYIYLMKHQLMTDKVEEVKFNLYLDTYLWYDFKYEPHTNTCFLFSIFKKIANNEIEYIAHAEKYNLNTNKLDSIGKTIIPKDMYKETFLQKYDIQFKSIVGKTNHYISFEMYRDDYANYGVQDKALQAQNITEAYALRKYKGIGILSFSNIDNKINWYHVIDWKTKNLSKIHFGYKNILIDDKLSILFYDNPKNYELNGLLKNTYGKDLKTMFGSSDKVMALVNFNDDGSFVRKLACSDKTLDSKKMKEPFIMFYEMDYNHNWVKFGDSSFLTQYEYKKFNSAGIINIIK